MPAHLTTSSYATLSLLALRPWSGYELTEQAKRSLRFALPKSERSLYSEPKKLVEHGLATAADEPAGKRPRTVYTITDAGRDALNAWMTTRPTPPQLEAEALLRLLFADNGTLDDLRSALDAFAEDAADLHTQVTTINSSYLDGDHPFPNRTHLSVLFATFQLELYDLIERWTEFAKTEIEQWPSTDGLGTTPATEQILRLIADNRPILENRTSRNQ